MVGSSSASWSNERQCVVAERWASRPAAAKTNEPVQDAGQQRNVLPLPTNRVQLVLIGQLRPGALSTGMNQHVQRRHIRVGVLCLDYQFLGALHESAGTGQCDPRGRKGA